MNFVARPGLALILLIPATVASAESKEVTARLAELATLDTAISQSYALAMNEPGVLVVVSEMQRHTIARLKQRHPKRSAAIDTFDGLQRQALAAARKKDNASLRNLSKKLGPLTTELGPLIVEIQQNDRSFAALESKLERVIFEHAQRIDPSYADKITKLERLEVEVRGLRGELRRAKRNAAPTLVGSRKGFTTKVFGPTDTSPAPQPPKGVLERVWYAAPHGKNVAYVTPIRAKKPGPAVLWIAGGFDWGIGAERWTPAPRSNDQSASALRQAGLTLMLPALRGSSGNPGKNECLLGEVDDVIAAAKYLAARKDVDPKRIYLAGHSTGATLALLVAEKTDMFRAVVAFGPISNPRDYGPICGTAKGLPESEAYVRAPIEFLEHIKTPTWIIEGESGNRNSVLELMQFSPGANMRFAIVKGAGHFSILRPASEILAREIRADTGDRPNLRMEAQRLATAVAAEVSH